MRLHTSKKSSRTMRYMALKVPLVKKTTDEMIALIFNMFLIYKDVKQINLCSVTVPSCF